MGTPALGKLSRLFMDVALPFSTSSIPLEFNSNTMAKKGNIISTDGMRGTRQGASERTRTGSYPVNGTLTLPASPLALDALLPYITGGAMVSHVSTLAETLPLFYLMEDKQTKVFTWSSIAVNKATFTAQMGKPLMLALDIEGETESVGSAGSAPVILAPIDSPWVMSDLVLNVGGLTGVSASEIELVIDNMLITDRYENSLTRTAFPSQGVDITLSPNNPYTSTEVSLYGQALAGAAGTLVFTNADVTADVLTFTFTILQAPDKTPVTNGPQEIRLATEYKARSKVISGAVSPAMTITNAHA